MSPLSLRRFRADRLLAEQFERVRGEVLCSVRGRLHSAGVKLDEADLDACYAIAWQALHAAVLAGEEIENPPGWLVTVCFRRAIDEQRARRAHGVHALAGQEPRARVDADEDQDDGGFAGVLEARDRMRWLFEGIGALPRREREAACLCFLHGLSRADAARQMGVSQRRLERLMDGRSGRAGVSAKLGQIAQTIVTGRFCEERASTMRALALGVLDPGGERHRLALAHQRSCPACRAYVAELRGLAAACPPFALPGVLELLRGALAAARAGASPTGIAGAGSLGAGGAAGAAQGAAQTGASAGTLVSTLGAKLAAAGLATVALGGTVYAVAGASGHRAHHRRPQASAPALDLAGAPTADAAVPAPSPASVPGRAHRRSAGVDGRVGRTSRVAGEFGFERLLRRNAARAAARRTASPARVVRPGRGSRSRRSAPLTERQPSEFAPEGAAHAATAAVSAPSTAASTTASTAAAAASTRALREFGIE